jgi:hypothetical protein
MVVRCWRIAFSSGTGEMALCSREAFFWQCANSIKVNHELLFERIHDKRKEACLKRQKLRRPHLVASLQRTIPFTGVEA